MTSDPSAAGSEQGVPPLPVALYVHVPFCLSKCAYCDFYSLAGQEMLYAPFVDAALFESGHWSHYDLLEDVPSLYLGGGTPTALGEETVRLVTGLRATARLRPDAEVTVETNPETTNPTLVGALVAEGVTRFSLGVQSFDDATLRVLGRCHDSKRAQEAAEVLRSSGVAFSLDLMCGAPGQTASSWRETLARAIGTGASHMSVYPLSIESGTPLEAAVRAGEISAPDPDVAAEMMLIAEQTLGEAGIARYEVANYARPGDESRHNQVYWTGGAYLGVGPHAASMLPFEVLARVAESEGWPLGEGPEGARAARARFTHETPLLDYLRAPLAAPAPFELLSAPEAAREDVMLRLRLTDGVSDEDVEGAGVRVVISSLEADGLVQSRGGRWRTTQRGWLLGNRVFGAVWAGGAES